MAALTGLVVVSGGVLINPAPALAALGEPASVTLTPGRRMIKVDWTAPTTPNGTVATYVATATNTQTNTTQTCTVNSPTLTCNISGLDPNVPIAVTVKACPTDIADCSAPKAAAATVKTGPPATPFAPTVTYTGASQNSMHLSWAEADAGAGILYYRVTSSPAFSAETGTCTAPQVVGTSCDVANLTANLSYSFRLTAIGINNATGTTGSSALGAASTPKYSGLPSQPDAPTVVRTSNSEAKVSWTKPSGGAAIGGYLVQKTTGGQTTDACTAGASATSCDVAALSPAATYTFTVKATGEGDAGVGGSSLASGASDAITLGKPNTPDAPTVELGATAGKVRVYWTAPEPGGGTVSGYVVTPYSNGANPSPCEVGPSVFSCDFDGLATDGTAYTFKVVAKGEADAVNSDASAASDPIVSQLPDKPNTPTAALVANTPGAVTLTWAPMGTGGPVIFYTVATSGDAQTGTQSGDCGFNLTTPSCTITGLNPDASYTFTVKAYGDLGWVESDASTPIVPNKPNAVTSPTVTYDTSTGATVNWTAPVGGGAVASYTATATPSDGSTATVGCNAVSSGTTSCPFTGLDSTKSYTFTVTATNAAGATDLNATVAVPNKPSPPQGVAVALTASTPGSVDLSWSGPASGTASRYIVTVAATDASTPPSGCTTATMTCTIGSLSTGKQYTFTVRAENFLGGSDASPTAAVKPDKPGAPTSVAVAVTASGEATVTWAAPATGGAVATYTVTATSPDGTLPGESPCTVDVASNPSAALSCAFTGMEADKSYQFTVRAANAVDGTDANPTAAVMPGGPATPSNVQVALGDVPSKVTVTWDPPTGAPVTAYLVTATSLDGGTLRTCTPATLTSNSCTFTDLTRTSSYQFVVNAANAVSGPTGVDSSAVPAQAIFPDQPGTPDSVTAVRGDLPGKATVNWAAPLSGGAVATYTVTATPSDGTTPIVGCNAVSAGTTSCAFASGTALDPAKSYTFTVRADNPAGHGDFTTTALRPDQPDKPSGVNVTVPAPGSAIVTWGAPTGAEVTGGWTVAASSLDGGAPVTGCSVAEGATRTCTITGMTTSATYTVLITATNTAGPTVSDPIGPIVADNPAAPGIPTAEVLSATSARLIWTESPASGGPAEKYSAKAYTAGAPSTPISSVACTDVIGLTCDFDGLSAAETYTFRVIALGPGGGSTTGGRSTPVTTAGPAKPAAPTVALEGNAVRVTWTAPVSVGPIISYSVTSTPDVSAPARCTNVQVLNCLFDRLDPGTQYTFKVSANGTAGRSVASDDSATITVPAEVPGAPGAPGAPGVPAVTVIAGNKVAVGWTAPFTGGPVIEYTVNAYTAGAPGADIVSAACTEVTALGCEFDGLVESESYTFRVTAIGPGGSTQGGRSAAVTTAAPGTPAAPTVALEGTNAVRVTWTAPGTGGEVTSYSVTSTPDVSAPARCTNIKGLTCIFDRLDPGTEYMFKVTAYGTADRLAVSDDSATITVPAVVPSQPGAPGVPAVTVIAGDKVAVGWTAPFTGGPVTEYTVNAYTAGAPGADIVSAACTEVTALGCEFDGLVESESYTFRVTAIGPGGSTQGGRSAAVTTAAPGTPAAPTVALEGTNAVRVTWTAPGTGGQVTSYSVTSTPDVSAPARCTNIKGLTCIFDRLDPGTEYMFKVTAYGTADRLAVSDDSATITVPAVVPSQPGAPGVPAVTVIAGDKVAVGWTAPFTGGPVTEYTVNAYTAGAPGADIVSAACTEVTALGCEFDGLVESESYTFRVTAIGPGGSTQGGRSAAVTTAAPGKPAAPTVALEGARAVRVTWVAPSGGPVTSYSVTSTPDVSAPARCTNIKGLTCIFDRLNPGTEYIFKVTAYGTADRPVTSDASESIIPGPPGTPAAPTVALTDKTGQIQVTWTPAAGGRIISYQVQADPGGLGCADPVGPTDTHCFVRGLDSATSYTFRVKALGAAGGGDSAFGPASAAITPGASAAPTDVDVAGGDRQIAVSWTAPSTAETEDSRVARYRAVATPGGKYCETTTDTECIISDLANLTSYTVTVNAITAGGVSTPSAPSARVRPTAGRPGSPTAVQATIADAQTVVSWTAPTTGGSEIAWYTATAVDPSGAQTSCTSANATTLSCTITGLTNGTLYSVTVVSVGRAASGYSAPSTAVTVTPKAPPGAPTGVTVTPGTVAKSLIVKWSAGSLSDAVTGYTATAGTGTSAPSCSTSATVLTCTISGLTPGVNSVTVVAKGASGNSAPSAAVDGTAQLAVAPTLTSTQPASGGTLNLSPTTAKVGTTVTVSGTGFAPFTGVALALYAGGTKLGTATTNANGAFSVDVTIPTGTAIGSKTVVAAAQTSATVTTVKYLTGALTVQAAV